MLSCYYVIMLSCHVGMGGLWFSHLAMSEGWSSQVRLQLSSLASSLAVHQWWEGWPPAYTLWFRVSHTHTTTVFATCCYISANQVCTCRCGCKLMCFCGACECACACVWMNALTYVGMYGCLHVWMDTWVGRWKDRSNVLTCTILYSVVL